MAEKNLTFIESAKIQRSDALVMSRDLERDAQTLRLTFPHEHQNMKAYQNMQANAEWWASLADLVSGDMSKYETLDEILVQLRQHVNLKDIDYGTNLFKQYADNTILHRLQSWDMEHTADYYSPEELDSLSVFDSTALYFEFPAYTGAILYLKPLRTSLLYICLEVGIQIIDNRIAYRFPRKDRKPYATIPLVRFQQSIQDKCFKSPCHMVDAQISDEDSANTLRRLWDELTFLNQGFCEGVWMHLCWIIQHGYCELFGIDEQYDLSIDRRDHTTASDADKYYAETPYTEEE